MGKTELVNLLCNLNSDSIVEKNPPLEFYESKYKEICSQLNCTYEHDVRPTLKSIFDLYFSSEFTAEFKYVYLNFYILHLLNAELESQGDILSVQQSKNVKDCIRNVVVVGICTKLQPTLPLYIKRGQPESLDIYLDYNILKCTTFGLCQLLKIPILRLLILPDSLKAILVALYQLCYCPLKKPTKEDSSPMTEEMYEKILCERDMFLNTLQHLEQSVHPGIFVKETMVMFQSNAPAWFKQRVSRSLTSIIRSKTGVENIAVALLGGVSNDSTQSWKILEVFSKLILNCRVFPDFEENICQQLVEMLEKITTDSLVYERLLAHCTRKLYEADQKENVLMEKVVGYFMDFTQKDRVINDGEILTNKLVQYVRLAYAIFVENNPESPRVPLSFLKPMAGVIFRLYVLTLDTPLKSVNNELQQILTCFIAANSSELFALFDCFLFGITTEQVHPLRDDIVLMVEGENIVVHHPEHMVSYSVTENSESLLALLKSKTNLMVNLFGYLLHCLIDKDKYFKRAREDLLNLEDEFMNEFLERSLVVYKLLSDLTEDKNVQKYITEKPEDIINYISNVLEKSIQTSTHETMDMEEEGFQSIFTMVMIVQQLVSNCSMDSLEAYKILIKPLKVMLKETLNSELKNLVGKTLEVLEGNAGNTREEAEEVKTELDKAIEDICDPLLPVRGHGLMTLTKLVEKKDNSVMERKQYILNIFQQNLRNQDSFIYLSAIAGLTAMADVFPDTVLNVLCEEYSDSSRKDDDDGHEVRIKLGESLVRVTKILGDMAPKYKSLLLNTFLLAAKDDDHLIRASSLSNLGEVCRVLGYKLGSIVTEVLVCVHAIIATDKSPEARRAAVTVIRQLFVGLDNEMIAFLKDDILPIYRTLKEIYNDDKDDVMRLQAQLALEELNENMRRFVFPKPQLNMEKKIIMLD